MARELDERSAFERAVADIAARFAAVDIGDLDDRIVESQRQLCGLLEVDRSWLWEPHGDLFTCTHLWSRDDIQAPVPLPDALEAREHLPWLLSQVEAGHIVAVSRIDDVPSAPDRESLRRIGTQSTITVPLSVGSKLIGILSFGTLRSERTWSGYTLEGLKLIAAVMANGLARHQATQALRSALDEVRRLRARLAPEHVQMRREVKAMKLPRQVAIDSASVRHLMEQVEQVAPTTATVLLMGETGSGKEVFAEAIHELSPRRHKPMVRLNCAAIPVSLIESELFGRERGAYTGALSRQAGRFEIAGRVDDLPRRDRRAAARRPGEAAARAAGAHRRAPRQLASDQGQRPGDRGDQPQPRTGGRRQDLPRGPVLPPQRVPAAGAAAAGARPGHPVAGVDLHRRVRRARSARRSSRCRRRASRRCSATRGPATSASCGT